MLDLTGDTVVASDVAQGKTFHLANGTQATGTNPGGGGTSADMYAQKTEPSSAVNGDLWVDTSDEGGSFPPSTITAGDTPVMCNPTFAKSSSSSALANTGISLTIPKAGTYRFKWYLAGGSGYTVYSRLYKNGTAVGTQKSTTNEAMCPTEDLSCSAGDVIAIWTRGYSYGGTWGSSGMLVACIDGDNGFTGGA